MATAEHEWDQPHDWIASYFVDTTLAVETQNRESIGKIPPCARSPKFWQPTIRRPSQFFGVISDAIAPENFFAPKNVRRILARTPHKP